MADLDTLVENYFAPKPKTLTKQMLYEIFDEVLREQEDEVLNFGQEILKFLITNGYKEAKLKVDRLPKKLGRGTFEITNIGTAKERNEAISKLEDNFPGFKPDKLYDGSDEYFIGGKFSNGNRVLLKQGANPTRQETIALTALKDSIKKAIEDYDLDPKKPISIAVTGNDSDASDLIYFKTTPEAINIKKTPKADFAIGTVSLGQGEEQIFISHKKGKEKMRPKDFGQYSGMTPKAGEKIYNSEEVQNFFKIVKKILDDLGVKTYPSSIDIQMPIKSKDLMLLAVFGKDYGNEKSSVDNIDYFIQGKLKLEPYFPPGAEEKPPEKFILRGDKVISRRFAASQINNIESLFAGGYLPILSVRKGDTSRTNIPGIKASRAQINPTLGRQVNFLLSPGSTPKNINFIPLKLNKTQFNNVKNFFNDLQINKSNIKLFNKMKNSVSLKPKEE